MAGNSRLLVPLGLLAGVSVVAALVRASMQTKIQSAVQGALGGSGADAAPPAPAAVVDPNEHVLDLAAAAAATGSAPIRFPNGSKVTVVSSAPGAKWVSDPTSDTPSVLYQTPGTRTFWAIAPGNASINAAWTSGHDYQGISQPIAIDP